MPRIEDESPAPTVRGTPAEGSDPAESLLRVDLHTHTRRSPDAGMDPAELLERADRAGLDRIAVTDHGEIDGALEAHELDPDRAIVGEEVRCACRTEVIGLFLRRRIPSGLPLEEAVERIRDQGGVVCAPHPYAYAWRPGRRAARVVGLADAVEVANARAFLPPWNLLASRIARRRGLPVLGGSDAHFPREVGRAYTLLPPFEDAGGLRRSLRFARPVLVRRTGPLLHLASAALRAAAAIRGPVEGGRAGYEELGELPALGGPATG